MKRLLMISFITTALMTDSFAGDSTSGNQLPQLLSYYYNIKNALIAGNANDATSAATSFIKVANTIDYKVISEGNISALIKDAGRISENKDISRQRSYFANLSANMALIARAVKLTNEPVYYAYCPMVKAYWLTSDKAIQNPYYGSAMLTCGEITETIR